MPPRKSTSSVTPVETEESQLQQLSSPTQTQTENVTATEQQLKARAEGGASVVDYLLPRSLTIRLAKAVLPPNTTIQKDAVLAIQKAATVFVSYLSSHANESTLKRTVAPADVFNALTELEFDSFRARLEKELDVFTEMKAGKRRVKKGDEHGNTDATTTATTGAAGVGGTSGTSGAGVIGAADEDVDMDVEGKPAKRVKRAEGDDGMEQRGVVDADETQDEMEDEEDGEEEEVEEEDDHEDDDEEEEEEDDDDEDGARQHNPENDIDHVEDLDRDPGARRGMMDPDADETDEEDAGPANQLRDDLGLG